MRAITEFKNYLKLEDKSSHTIRAYVLSIKMFKKFLKNKALDDAQRVDVINFIGHLRSKGYKSSTIRRHFYAIKRYYDYYLDNEKVCRKIPLPDSNEPDTRALTVDQLKTILEKCYSLQDEVLVRVGYDIALRVSELVEIKINDIDFEEGYVKVTRRKKRKSSVADKIPISKPTLEVIEEYLELRSDKNVFLFPGRSKTGHITESTAEYRLNKIFKRAKIKYTGQHLLRHSRATNIRLAGVPIDTLKEFLGHKSINTTLRYSHLTSEQIKKEVPLPEV
jgi:integrase/recombinase XerD